MVKDYCSNLRNPHEITTYYKNDFICVITKHLCVAVTKLTAGTKIGGRRGPLLYRYNEKLADERCPTRYEAVKSQSQAISELEEITEINKEFAGVE